MTDDSSSRVSSSSWKDGESALSQERDRSMDWILSDIKDVSGLEAWDSSIEELNEHEDTDLDIFKDKLSMNNILMVIRDYYSLKGWFLIVN
jgi:hypothetical protein